jgi:hypothetical protein
VQSLIKGEGMSNKKNFTSPERGLCCKYPQWLLGKTIHFKNTGTAYVVGCVMDKTLMIGRGDGVLRTIKSTTKTILGNDFYKCINFTEYWEHKGQGLLQLTMRENFGSADR